MITASEIKSRAWMKLGEGNWPKAMGAFCLFWLMGMVVSQAMARVGLAAGGIENVSLADFMQRYGEMFNRLGVAMPGGLTDQLDGVVIPVVRPWYRIVQFVVTTFAQGVFAAGWAVFTVAVMRNGANALQVFSGFHRLFSTGWLMLLQSMRIALWSLLLVVPGIVALYAYRMSFFIKADHPEWSAWRVLAESRRMMKGHKWRLMCLDASFIGWLLLVLVTFGLAALFVAPYMDVAEAAFYEDLLDRNEGLE